MWLSGWSAGLQTKGSWVLFPIRALVCIAGQVPSRGRARDNHTLMFLSLSFSLPSPLPKINKEINTFKKDFQFTELLNFSFSVLFFWESTVYYLPMINSSRHVQPNTPINNLQTLCHFATEKKLNFLYSMNKAFRKQFQSRCLEATSKGS